MKVVSTMSETDEFLPHHGDGAAGCTKGRWTVSNWKKSENTQGSWMMSAGNLFADEKEDTGLQTVENSKFFGRSNLSATKLIIRKRPTQHTPGNLVRSLECLSKCCHTFNATCDQEEGDC